MSNRVDEALKIVESFDEQELRTFLERLNPLTAEMRQKFADVFFTSARPKLDPEAEAMQEKIDQDDRNAYHGVPKRAQ